MKRIILHHTAGLHKPNSVDLEHYHFIVDGEGQVHKGKHPVLANAAGKPLRSGHYAAHTANLNTDSIGVSVAAMHNGQWKTPRSSAYFPTRQQLDAFLKLAAELAAAYKIPVRRDTILSHAEVEQTLGVRQAGKWDFDYDPYGVLASRDPVAVGDMLRLKISEYLEGLKAGQEIPQSQKPDPARMPLLRRGHRGEAVRYIQSLLNQHGFKLGEDGIFGPATYEAVREYQYSRQLLSDGIVGKGTWTSLIGESK